MNPATQLLRAFAFAILAFVVVAPLGAAPKKGAAEPLTLIVLDPLARELACACVKGYGQRDYRKLAARLEKACDQKVSIEFSDDLADTLDLLGQKGEILVIGDSPMVEHSARKSGFKCAPIAELTGQDGASTLTASFVARADDPALELKDLAGRELLIGLPEADEKFAASMAALKDAGIPTPAKIKHLSYSDAALDMLDSNATPPPIAVLPSYAPIMLQGCGSVKPGNLRVIGQSRPVPFIRVFASEKLNPAKRGKIVDALMALNADADFLKILESKSGFKPLAAPQASGRTGSNAEQQWSDWRGPRRDGRVPKLPARLPNSVNLVWKRPSVSGALAGLTVSDGRLISAERDLGDENDVFRCLNADTGELLWRIEYSAKGKLDYGQSPRAAPVIHQGRAYLLGAFGHLKSVDVTNGKIVWERRLTKEFGAPVPIWGACSPPLIVDDLLIVNPGATNGSIAALELATGNVRWKTPGLRAAYSAFICAELGGRRQIVGYDEHSLGGWDVATGERLWQLTPPTEGDFNVPTPIAAGGGLLVSTENNGTRFYNFDKNGRIAPKPAATFADLSPDTTSLVVVGDRVFGSKHERLFCLDLQAGLKPVWQHVEDSLGDHVTFFADNERVLAVTLGGELILLDAKADRPSIISRLKLFEEDFEMYSHPALVGTRLFARGPSSLVCVDLGLN